MGEFDVHWESESGWGHKVGQGSGCYGQELVGPTTSRCGYNRLDKERMARFVVVVSPESKGHCEG